MSTLGRRSWLLPLVFVAALVVYLGSAAALERLGNREDAYFDLLAEAFLHGRLHLVAPPVNYDLTNHEGRWYVPFPPLPALLMLPWAALVEPGELNTVLFGAIVGAANVAAAFGLLQALSRRGWSALDIGGNLWLAALFGAGSVHWYMSTLGTVWFLGQICAVGFVLAGAWAAVATGSPLLAGSLVAVAMLGRPNLALSFPLLLGVGAQHLRASAGGVTTRGLSWWGARCLAPMAATTGLLLWYNVARFGSPWDFGYLTQNVAQELADDLRIYGQFHLRYLPHNLWAMLLAGPVWNAGTREILPTIDGMSLLLTTPALIYLADARRLSALTAGAWVALALLLVPLLTYYNTGWWQFGYRFSLDFMAPVLVLLAAAAGPRVGWRMRLLILLGVVVNAWGTWWFQNPRYF